MCFNNPFRSKYYSSTFRGVDPNDIFLEDSEAKGQQNMPFGSSYGSFPSDSEDSSDYSSYYEDSPARKFPTSNLNMKHIERLYREKEKLNKKKAERKARKQKINEEKKKQREEREKAQQVLINAEKQKLAEERQKQREANRRGLKRYEITAIEFDWLFNEEHGRNFLVDLTRTQSLEIFSIDLIVKIILFLWNYYRRAIFIQILLPFLIYFVTFLIYGTWVYWEEEKDNSNQEEQAWYSVNVFIVVIIIVFVIYNILFELRKL